LVPGAEDRVPFLLVLREFAGSFRDDRLELTRYLEQVCRAPYNLDPPRHAVEYLLRNGRATVVLDGLDELVDPELRRTFVQLVEGFASRFPLVPILVTARKIGYLDAPLNHRTFTVGVVAELNEEQVTQYSERWFALDTATADVDRSRMATAFLRESANITDLRANTPAALCDHGRVGCRSCVD
jgi:predicted NACHT family NTPase